MLVGFIDHGLWLHPLAGILLVTCQFLLLLVHIFIAYYPPRYLRFLLVMKHMVGLSSPSSWVLYDFSWFLYCFVGHQTYFHWFNAILVGQHLHVCRFS